MMPSPHVLPEGRASCLPHGQRGLSLIELLVGLAIGAFVSAVALAALVQQTAHSRRLVLDDRLDQDLHVTLHLLARHLRRAGHWAEAAQLGIWRPGASPPAANPHGVAPGPADQLRFTYSSPGGSPAASSDLPEGERVAAQEHFGFRLRQHILDIELGNGRWQPLTDPSRLHITALRVEPRVQDRPVGAACSRPCPTEGPACPPRARTQGFDVSIDAVAAHGGTGVRRVAGHVRLRNDQLIGACPT